MTADYMHREPQTLYKITSLCKSGCTPMILIRFSPTEAVLFTLEINLYAPLFCHGFSILFCLEKLVWMPPDGWLNALYGASFSEQNKISHFSFKCVHHIEILFVCALPWHCLALHVQGPWIKIALHCNSSGINAIFLFK